MSDNGSPGEHSGHGRLVRRDLQAGDVVSNDLDAHLLHDTCLIEFYDTQATGNVRLLRANTMTDIAEQRQSHHYRGPEDIVPANWLH